MESRSNIINFMAIYRLPITPAKGVLTNHPLLPYVSAERQKKVCAYRFPKDQKLSLYAALLARYGISQQFHIPVKELTFTCEPFHKPFCDQIPSCDFSLSHTDGMVLLGVKNTGIIGADVECKKNAPYRIMPSVFHEEEIAYITSAAPEEQNYRFFEIWTQKEAYTKAIGTGLCTEVTKINTLSLSEHFLSWQDTSHVYSIYYEQHRSEKPVTVSEEALAEFYHRKQPGAVY